MDYVLGIDQGSSHTRAALTQPDGVIVAYGRAAGACHSITGMDSAMRAVREASAAALTQTNIGAADIAHIAAGMTGADWPDEYALLRDNLLALGLAPSVSVSNDAIIALRGGTSRPWGAVVIAGSGANCAVRSPTGEEFIYHYYVEPELQGGDALGRRALRAVYRAATGREQPTALTIVALDWFGVESVDALLRAHVEGRLDDGRIMGFAPRVIAAANDGDAVATAIIRNLAEGLAGLVTAALQRLEMTALDIEVVVSGSIFRAPGHLLHDVMAASIAAVAPSARLVNARYEPVVGAALLALEQRGVVVGERVMHNVETSSRRLGLIRT